MGYCGLYCGACGIYWRRIKLAVENLRKVIGVYGFDKISPELAKWNPLFQFQFLTALIITILLSQGLSTRATATHTSMKNA
jgi:hypothetical protein